MKTISIVVPVYFNSKSLPALASELNDVAGASPEYEFEFIFVDDGSADNSSAVILELAHKDSRVRLIKLSRNFGSNTAILAGLSYASGDCAGFIAADLQDPPQTLRELIVEWERGSKVVLAVRRNRDDPLFSRYFAAIFNWLFKVLVFKDFSPQGIGFFLIDRQVVNVIVESSEKNAHIIGLVLWSGFDRNVVYYDRQQRRHGQSRWTFTKKIKYFIDAFSAFSYLPIRASSVLGILLAIAGLLYAVLITAIRISGGAQVEGWSALMVVLLVVTGVQLIMLGIVGEYLWRNLDATRSRPVFIVDKTSGFEPGDATGPLGHRKDDLTLIEK